MKLGVFVTHMHISTLKNVMTIYIAIALNTLEISLLHVLLNQRFGGHFVNLMTVMSGFPGVSFSLFT